MTEIWKEITGYEGLYQVNSLVVGEEETTMTDNELFGNSEQLNDTISRQAVIDTLLLGKEILSRVLDDMDVVGTDREKYSWGLGLIESSIKDIEELPSAQQEIVACGDCIHWICHDRRCGYWNHGVKPLDWCCHAERRTNG